MFKIEFHPYALQLKNRSGSNLIGLKREGALMRCRFPDGSVGYSDIHPWEELGDLPISKEIESLMQGRPTPLGFRALQLASQDADLRKRGVGALEGVSIPKSHFLISGSEYQNESLMQQIATLGFDTIKVKAGSDLKLLDKIADSLKHLSFKIRIDFNGRLPPESLSEAIKRLKPIEEKIDFLEDPTSFDRPLWVESMRREGLSFALDAGSEGALADNLIPFLIMKPAKQNESQFIEKADRKQKIVVTTYLGHPIGQVQAAYVAAKMQKSISLDTCGLKSHDQYEEDPFSERLGPPSPQFHSPGGTGFGFDDLLSRVAWS